MLTIGSVELEHPFTLAALSGFSDPAMRRMARRFGASYAVNEVVLDRSVTHEGEWQKKLLSLQADDHPVGGQLMGSDPDGFARAAVRLADAGYDVIDINFGCPSVKVLGRCRGGYLLSEPAAALEIVRRVIDAVGKSKPVTVKMRRGLDGSAESVRKFYTILDGAFECGVAAITVHGRTVEQGYTGKSDWRFLADVKRHAGCATILGSGDLISAKACLDMLSETGVDGVAIARGAMGNPWIFRDCLALHRGQGQPPAPTVDEQAAVLRSHLAEIKACYGDRAIRVFNKDAMKYAKLHPCGRQLRNALQGANTVEKFQSVIDEWYGLSEERAS